MNLDFLKEISLTKTEVKTKRTAVDVSPQEGAHLRLFKDGRMYPSAELTEDCNLEYTDKGAEVGNGFDITDTEHFINYPQDNVRLIMVSLVSKKEPKVDLFGSVGYNSDNTPKVSVTEQGSKTTGTWLIDLLEEVYGEPLFEDCKYVDLVVNFEYPLNTPNNIYHLPKKVSRGEMKGQITYQRRTDTTLYPLTVFNSIEETTEVEEVEEVKNSK